MHSPLLSHFLKQVKAAENLHMLLPSIGHECNTNSTKMDEHAVVFISVGTLRYVLVFSAVNWNCSVRERNEYKHGKEP